MRKILISMVALSGVALAAVPLAAQHRDEPREERMLRGGAEAVRQAAPMLDRSTDAALNLDIGPILDALQPMSPRGRSMTLRELGRSNDPDFERKLRGSIYRGSARAAAMLDAMATATPSLRQSLRQMESAIAGAVVEARRPLPPEAYGPPPRGYEAPRDHRDDDAPPPPYDDEEDDGAPW